MKKTTPIQIDVRGYRAIESGKPLWILGLDGRWTEADPGARERVRQMPQRCWWIYGVES